jgi:predicted transporter
MAWYGAAELSLALGVARAMAQCSEVLPCIMCCSAVIHCSCQLLAEALLLDAAWRGMIVGQSLRVSLALGVARAMAHMHLEGVIHESEAAGFVSKFLPLFMCYCVVLHPSCHLQT